MLHEESDVVEHGAAVQRWDEDYHIEKLWDRDYQVGEWRVRYPIARRPTIKAV